MDRREALKRIWGGIVACGASSFLTFEDLLAADAKPIKPVNVIWLHGTSCSGCSVSLLNIEYVSVPDIITKFANLVFHPDLSLATGDQVETIIDKLTASGLPYIFVLEGAIPTALPHACLMADKPMTHWVDRVAGKATACIAVGTCAALGGVTRMAGMTAGSLTLAEYLKKKGIQKPVVNLPNCPLKPEHFVYTLLHYVRQGALPPLDRFQRPTRFFSQTVHERCIYYADFQEKRYARKIGDNGCLLKLGCQGPVTRNDCLINGHNNNTASCIRQGHPCIGCTSEHFPRQIMFHSFGDVRAAKKGFKAT